MLKKTFKSSLSIKFFSFFFVAVWISSAPLHVLATAEDDLENFRNTNPKWRSFVSLCQPQTLFCPNMGCFD